jgi:glyoxylase-like metal-dependent hydrolase (beta-lactamase superfamily II)
MQHAVLANPAQRRLDRRGLLKAAAALATAVAAPSAAGRLAAEPSRTLKLGASEIRIVSDGFLTLPMSFVLPDTAPAEIAALLEPLGLSSDAVRPDCNVTLLKARDRLVLFDAGAGSAFQPSTGALAANLEDAGIAAEAVTDVVFTHAHPDHLWGVVDDFGDLRFPNATYRIARTEWDYWRAEDTLAKMPDDRKSFVVGARNRFAAIEERVELFGDSEEVVAGIEAVATPGHTPGHTSFVVHDDGDGVVIIGDALANAAVSFARPQWRWGSDHDGDAGAATRARLLDRLAGEKSRIVGFHLPYPGAGVVERAGGAYRFAAA